MANVKVEAANAQQVIDAYGQVFRALSAPHTAAIMKVGAEVVAEGVRDNILENELVDSGDLYDAVTVKGINQYAAAVSVDIIYAAVHEYGLENQPITPRQRAFFWAMHLATGDDMWKALALSSTYTIPARPYVRPAIDEKQKDASLAMMREAASRLTRLAGIGGK